MDGFVIRGGRPLSGRIRVGGAKNAILPILAACLLTEEECIIRDVPRLSDVEVMIEILRGLGVRIRWENGPAGGILRVRAREVTSTEIPLALVRRMRSSVFLMGPLLGRAGRVRLSYPGGCAIGSRPIDFHMGGLRSLGTAIREEGGYIDASAEHLTGAQVSLDQPSVGATENVIMAAVLARGTTVIKHGAREPEIVDLACFLNLMGAKITGAGTDEIRIRGVSSLGGADHRLIPDRIEAGTYLVAAAITGGDIILDNVVAEHLKAVSAKLCEAGAQVQFGPGTTVRLKAPERLRAVDIRTMPHPGFPTDLQSQFMALLSLAKGTSVITETIFENRFKVATEMRRMGADIAVDGRMAIVRGVPRLTGSLVEAMDDLRGGAALVLAGLAAEGVTLVDGRRHIERGYEGMDRKLRLLGADIWPATPAAQMAPGVWPVAR